MIVPFVMTMLVISKQPYLWNFYTLAQNIAKKQKGVIIAQEEYFTAPSEFEKQARKEVCDENFMFRFGYDKPTDKYIKSLNGYSIPADIEQRLVKKLGSYNTAQLYYLTEYWDELGDLLEKYISEIESKYGEKIEAFISLCHCHTLQTIAEKHGIRVIHTELGALREPAYIRTMYLDYNNLYGNSSAEERYEKFRREREQKDIRIFSSPEILSLMYSKPFLKYLTKLSEKPTYKMGVALGYTTWPMFRVNTDINDEELLYTVSRYYTRDEFITRKHPSDPASAQYPAYDYSKDTDSANTVEFILKCERIASLGSNVSFEAMLYGRTPYTLTYYGPYYKSKHDISDTENYRVEDSYISFYTFGYLAPYELAMDVDYIKWRLSDPSEIEIYERHLEYYLKARGIKKSDLSEKDITHLVMKKRGFNEKKDCDFSKRRAPYVKSARDYMLEIEDLRRKLQQYEQEEQS